MKTIKLWIGLFLAIPVLAFAETSVIDVVVAQRWPWNGLVDIEVDVRQGRTRAGMSGCSSPADPISSRISGWRRTPRAVVKIPFTKVDDNYVMEFTLSRSSVGGLNALVTGRSTEANKASYCGSRPLLITHQAEGVYHGELLPRIEGYAIVFDVTIEGYDVPIEPRK